MKASFLIDKIRAWRYGYTGITGLNQMQNNFKMLVILLGPFLGLWFGAQYIVYMEYVPLSLGPVVQLTAIGVWLMFCLGYWAYITTDASKYKGFPQATFHYPDGGVVKYDLMVKPEPEGIKERCQFPDGSLGIELEFLNRYMYQARDMPFPYVFDKALMRIPAETGKAFKFLSSGEFWHRGMVVETPNNEHISFFVYGWVKENGEWKPVGVVNDCSLRYQRALENHSADLDGDEKFLPPEAEADINWMLYKGALQREDELQQYCATLESTLETVYEQKGPQVKKQVDEVLKMVRDGVHDITSTAIPVWKRIFNFGFLWKAILAIIAIWVVLHFMMGVI